MQESYKMNYVLLPVPAEVLDELLTQWKNLGYRFETIDKLFA